MKLGRLIEILEQVDDPDQPVLYDTGARPSRFMSWRGRYNELTLASVRYENDPVLDTVGKLLDAAKAAVGTEFFGYKGGEFVMNDDTPVWADDYGECDYRGILHLVSNGRYCTIITALIGDYI